MEHYNITGYPLAVKLGTITPDGADVYSYDEDDMVLDPKLSQHLAHFGIDITSMTKVVNNYGVCLMCACTVVHVHIECSQYLQMYCTSPYQSTIVCCG